MSMRVSAFVCTEGGVSISTSCAIGAALASPDPTMLRSCAGPGCRTAGPGSRRYAGLAARPVTTRFQKRRNSR